MRRVVSVSTIEQCGIGGEEAHIGSYSSTIDESSRWGP